MSRPKKSKPRGRPPKYVLDDKGKEIVGLSYNHTNGMFYATGTNPRHYFQVPYRIDKRQEAIRQFLEWKKNTGYTAEDIEQQNYRNEVYQKAVSLIEDGHLKELLEKKARELVDFDPIINVTVNERAKELLMNEDLIRFAVNENMYDLDDKDNVYVIIAQKTWDLAKEWVGGGRFDKDVWERAYDLIKDDPYEAAKILGIKEIIHANENNETPMKLHQAWSIFNHNKAKQNFLYEPEIYYTVQTKIWEFLGDPFLYQIKYAELKDALESDQPINPPLLMTLNSGRKYSFKYEKERINKLMDDYDKIPMMDRLEILEDIFTTVKDAGYDQMDKILRLLRQLSYEIK